MIRALDILLAFSWFLFFQHVGTKWIVANIYEQMEWVSPIMLSYFVYFIFSFLIPSSYLLLRYDNYELLNKLSINMHRLRVCIVGILAVWFLFLAQKLFVISSSIDISHFQQTSNAFIIIVLFGPFMEELFFRGAMFEIISKKWGNTSALFIISVISLVAHIQAISDIGSIVVFFLGSVIFTLVYIEGGLIIAFLVHLVANWLIISNAISGN